MTQQIRSNAMEILKENFRLYGNDTLTSFEEYVFNNAKNDPSFYNWLFPEADNIADFGIGMTEEQNMEAAEFFAYTKVESHYLQATLV